MFSRKQILLTCTVISVFLLLIILSVFSSLSEDHLSLPITWSQSGIGFDQHLLTKESLKHVYLQTGWAFNDKGRSRKFIVNLTSSLVHSFSPRVERDAARKFLDPLHGNVFVANSPAVLWHNGELVLVCRIWLKREIYGKKKNMKNNKEWPANQFPDNFLFTQKFDRYLRPISSSSLIGIPAPKQFTIGDGPIEPRLFQLEGKLYVTFNTGMIFPKRKFIDYTVIWDMQEEYPIIPEIKGGSPMANISTKTRSPRDKHWMPFIKHEQLYFVHTLDPLRVMKCDNQGHCQILPTHSKRPYSFSQRSSHLRGGTPFVRYQDNYFISIAHVTLFRKSNGRRFYTANIVMMDMDAYRIVFVSDDIRIHPEIYKSAPMARPKVLAANFIFPVSLILEDSDSLVIGVHVNDFSAVLLRLRGVARLLKKVIKHDRQERPLWGPPAGYIQEHVLNSMEKITNITFIGHPMKPT